MATTFTQTWTDGSVVLAPYALIKAASHRVVIDLRTKIEAHIQIGVGFGGSTDLTNGVDVRLYRCLGNDAAAATQYATTIWQARTGLDPGVAKVNNGAGYDVAAVSIAYDGGAGRAFVAGDKLCFWGETAIPEASGAIATPTVEFITAGKAAATPFLLDTGLKFAHADNEYIGLANTWAVWVSGGSTYALVFDYLDDAAGEAVCCAASMQTHDSDSGEAS
jgi:hypothetical protein